MLAVSGGLDSMVLCALLHELQLPIKILHVNYGLRGTESDADQVFVTAYCQKHHIELEVHEVGLKNQLANNKLNLQAEARRIRYAFFKEVQAQTPNSLLCTAHQADDQANDADNGGVHPQGPGQSVDEVATGVGQGIEQPAEQVDDKPDDRTYGLAKPLEEAFYLHVCVLMRRWACLCLWLLLQQASSLPA